VKTCTYCGCENRDDAFDCRKCGTTEFVGSAPPPPAAPAERERSTKSPDTQGTGESPLCTSCLFPNPPDTPFCKRCGAPIGPIATVGPLEHVYAEGHAYRQAVEGPPKAIVVLGVWMIFFPTLLLGLLCMASMLIGRRGLAGGIFFLLFGGLAWISVVMLYRVTKNFIQRRRDSDPGR